MVAIAIHIAGIGYTATKLEHQGRVQRLLIGGINDLEPRVRSSLSQHIEDTTSAGQVQLYVQELL